MFLAFSNNRIPPGMYSGPLVLELLDQHWHVYRCGNMTARMLGGRKLKNHKIDSKTIGQKFM